MPRQGQRKAFFCFSLTTCSTRLQKMWGVPHTEFHHKPEGVIFWQFPPSAPGGNAGCNNFLKSSYLWWGCNCGEHITYPPLPQDLQQFLNSWRGWELLCPRFPKWLQPYFVESVKSRQICFSDLANQQEQMLKLPLLNLDFCFTGERFLPNLFQPRWVAGPKN